MHFLPLVHQSCRTLLRSVLSPTSRQPVSLTIHRERHPPQPPIMGKYTDEDPLPLPSPSPALGESSSAISLGVTPTSEPPIQRYFDDDPTEFDADDLPPLYTEHDRDNVPQVDPLLPSGAPRLAIEPFRTDHKTGISYYIDRRLDTDHKFLLDQLATLSLSPPVLTVS